MTREEYKDCIAYAKEIFVMDEDRASYYSNLSSLAFAYIDDLEAEVVQYKAELDRVLEANKKAVTRLNEWNPELAQDFMTLLLMDLQKKE
jgi:hypothetical protein